MTRLRLFLAELPAQLRWSILGAAGVLLVLLLGIGVWSFLRHRDDAANRAFAPILQSYRQTVDGSDAAAQEAAVASLKSFLSEYPRSDVAAEAWYCLGALESRRGRLDDAIRAYEQAGRRSRGSLTALARLSLGYAWEAKGDAAQALAVYRAALEGLDARSFLYADLLIALGRAQEQTASPGQAIETYKRLLKDVPGSGRAEEIRVRIGLLGGSVS